MNLLLFKAWLPCILLLGRENISGTEFIRIADDNDNFEHHTCLSYIATGFSLL